MDRQTAFVIQCSANETLEEYRRMTPGQRLSLTLRMMKENTPFLLQGRVSTSSLERFELLERENDARNRNMLTAIARNLTDR